jgi:hypothetical protein
MVTSNMLAPRTTNLGPAAPESYVLTGKNLRLPGFLWKLQRRIELNDIQNKYRRQWFTLHEQRHELLKRYGYSLMTSTSSIATDHMRRRERAVTQILFEVLMSLRNRGDIMAADAIWQSVWNPAWPNAGRSGVVFQSVDDFPEDVKIESRRNMFRLDKIDAATFHPEWLIDRIMNQGSIWVASLVRSSQDDEYSDGTSNCDVAAPDSANRLFVDMFDETYDKTEHAAEHQFFSDLLNNLKENLQLARTSCTPDDNGIEKVLEKVLHDENRATSFPLSISEMFSLLQNKFWVATTGVMLQMMMEMFVTTYAGYPTQADASKFRQSSAFTLQTMLFSILLEFKELSRMSLLRSQCAIFDIDGTVDRQALILTPFQLSMEGVVAPGIRNLSISRVVQKVGEGADDAKYETFRTKRMVKGMWQSMMYPGGRYIVT